MTVYIAPEYRELLESNSLDTFDSVWQHPVRWLDEPNRERGGWSGVGRIALESPQGTVGAYLKRQDNHNRFSYKTPFSGEPTFSREFWMLKYLGKCGVATPRLMLYGERRADGRNLAVLMTEELTGYRPLEDSINEMFANGKPSLAEQNALIRAVANAVRKLHDAKVEHRALYPKHIYVITDMDNIEVAFIDLEKARRNPFSPYTTYLDLAALDKRSRRLSRTRRLYFYMQYLGISKLTPWTKWLCKCILRRSARRSKRGSHRDQQPAAQRGPQ